MESSSLGGLPFFQSPSCTQKLFLLFQPLWLPKHYRRHGTWHTAVCGATCISLKILKMHFLLDFNKLVQQYMAIRESNDRDTQCHRVEVPFLIASVLLHRGCLPFWCVCLLHPFRLITHAHTGFLETLTWPLHPLTCEEWVLPRLSWPLPHFGERRSRGSSRKEP